MHSPDLDYESILNDPEYSHHLGPQTHPSPDAETRNASSHVSQRRQPSLTSTDYSDSPRNSQVALPRAGGTFSPPTALPPSFAPPPPKPSAAGLTSRTSARSSTLSSTLEHNPNSVVKRKPLSSTASALAAARSSAASLYNRNTNASQVPSPAHRQSVLSETSLYSTFSESLSDRSPAQNPAFVSAGPPYDSRGSATNPLTEPRPLMGLGLQHLTDDLPPPPPPKDLSPQTNNRTAYDDYDDYNDDDSLYDSIYNNTNTTNANTYPAVVEQQPSLGGYDGAIETATAVQAITITQVGKQNSKPVELDNGLQPKAPVSPTLTKLGSLFSWGSTSPSRSEFSSIASPVSPRTATATDAAASPRANDTQANGNGNTPTNREPALHTPLSAYTQPSGDEIDEMEDELKAIGGELAASIRREMDLEDLVDRLQADLNNNSQAPGKRTSDYYSDSGISSAKFSEFDHTREEVEKIQRRAEQEKAQLRLDLTTKLQDEREKRRELDLQIKDLSEKAAQVDAAQMNGLDASGRLQTLEATCGDLRRRLSEEREVKDNFEDLLGVLRGELQMATNERDNLRDEIVPQLRARVEGLESQAADHTNLTYETTKMQQDLKTLREENEALRKSREADAMASRVSMTLSRSNSLAGRPPPFKLQQAPATLARSNTTTGKPESKDALAERLKDVEAQRDALHSALKNLLDRQEYQNRENEKKIKYLEVERDRLLTDSPKKAGYEKDIANLRNEVSVLRRRAEDAMEQKWKVEEGLAHMKMDLDRAEEEISMLRSLLGEKDILIPPIDSGRPSDMSSRARSGPVSSASLEKAYRDLQASYTDALERIEASGTVASNEKTQLAMKRLELTLSAALSERDAAREEAAACKSQLDSLMAGEAGNLTNESALASELRDSAERVEQLAALVKTQLEANSELRQRLSDAVTRGEADRKSNVDRVTRLQNRLKTLEDQLVAAQTASEERVARHEAEITSMREAHNAQLHRLSGSAGVGSSLRSPRTPGLGGSARQSPLPSPLFPRTPRTPRFAPQKTIEDDAEVSRLRDRVAELERAVAESEREMQDVVAKMSAAQIEVMTLQEARDAAVRETRRVQAALEAEGMRGFEERFRTLGSA